MTSNLALLAWLELALWLGALALYLVGRDRAAAMLSAVVALPFLIAPLVELLKWSIDPAWFVQQYGTAALRELPQSAVVLGLSLLSLVGCGFVFRRRRRWVIVPFVLNAAGVAAWFYFAYFFRIF